MIGESVVKELETVIKKLGYEGANWEWAIHEQDGQTKLHFLKITVTPLPDDWRPKCLFRKSGLSLYRAKSSLKELMRFINYCLSTRREHEKSHAIPVDETGYVLGPHTVKLFGNFTTDNLMFLGSTNAKAYWPIKSCRPVFLAQYALHDSVRAKIERQFSLLGASPPFANVHEAYKHYFKVQFGDAAPECWAAILVPVEVAYVHSFKTTQKELLVELRTATAIPKNLFLSVVCRRNGTDDFRKRIRVTNSKTTFNIGFQPTSLDLALNLNDFQIDRAEWFDRSETQWPDNFSRPIQEEQPAQHRALFSLTFLGKLPHDIRFCLEQTEQCYENQLWVPACLMLRKALDLAVNLKMKQLGKDADLYDGQGRETFLQERLKHLAKYVPGVRRDLKKVLDIKWFGDKGAHSAMEISESDVRAIVAPQLRAFLTELELKNQ